jgi:hypothetical protein
MEKQRGKSILEVTSLMKETKADLADSGFLRLKNLPSLGGISTRKEDWNSNSTKPIDRKLNCQNRKISYGYTSIFVGSTGLEGSVLSSGVRYSCSLLRNSLIRLAYGFSSEIGLLYLGRNLYR